MESLKNNSVKSKVIGITGIAGMLGSHLSEQLITANYTVKGIDNLSVGKLENLEKIINNEKFSLEINDGRNIDALRKIFKDCDTIIHLAAVKKVVENQSSFETLDVNVKITQNVLEIAKEKNINVIMASTSDVYGVSEEIPFKENQNLKIGDSTAKRWAYAVSKLYCEHLCISYCKDFDVKVCILRYFGGFSDKSSFTWSGGHVPIFINQILNGDPITIHGDGKQTRSMGHADDLAYGTFLAMINIDKVNGEIINIGNTEEFSVIDTAYLVADILKKGKNDIKIEFIPEEKVYGTYKDLRRRVPDISKARRLLGYEPKISFKQALELVAASIKEKKNK